MQFTELSESTVKRCLKDLDNNNFISIKNRFETFLGDAKRQTSNMYHLQVGVQTDTHGVQPETGGGVTVNPHVTTNKNHIYCQDFLKVWNAYPRKDGSKKKAYEIWTKITEKDCIIIKKSLFNHVEKYNKLKHECSRVEKKIFFYQSQIKNSSKCTSCGNELMIVNNQIKDLNRTELDREVEAYHSRLAVLTKDYTDIELKLNESEILSFKHSTKAVKELFDAAIKIDPLLEQIFE